MADNKVKFLRGTAAEYESSIKDNDTFYYTTDTKKLYLGNKEITSSSVTIDDTISDTSKNPVQNKAVFAALNQKADKTVATTDTNGLMSAEDKAKLDGISDSGGGGEEIKTLTSENGFLDLTQLPQNGMILDIQPDYGTSTGAYVYGVNTTNLFCPLVHSGLEDGNFGGTTTYAGHKNNTLGVSKQITDKDIIVSGTATETSYPSSGATADHYYNIRTMLGYFLPVGEVTIDVDVTYYSTDSAIPKFYINNTLYNITDFPITLSITSDSYSYIYHYQVSREKYNFRVAFYVHKSNYDKNNLTQSSAFSNDSKFYQYTQSTVTKASTCKTLFNDFIRSNFYLTKDKMYTEGNTGVVYYTPRYRSGFIDICKYAFLYSNTDFTIRYVEDRNSIAYDNKSIGLLYKATSTVDFDIHSFVLIKPYNQQANKISSIKFKYAQNSSSTLSNSYVDAYVGYTGYGVSISKHPEGIIIQPYYDSYKYFSFEVLFEG